MFLTNEVHAVVQDEDMQKASNSRIKIKARTNITFDSAASSFHSLVLESEGGVIQNYNVYTTDEGIQIVYSGSDLIVSANADLYSAHSLYLSGDEIEVTGPSKFQAEGNLTILTPGDRRL